MFDDQVPEFEEDAGKSDASETLILRLEGYEGPLDALLDLAHRQKVDLREISVLALAQQYIEFVEEARSRNLQLAADYLVMASWLTYLKTRLLLPKQEDDEELSGEEIAALLAHRLRRLDAMRKAARALTGRRLLGRDVFPRGERGTEVRRTTHTAAELYDLLQAYSSQRLRAAPPEKRKDPIPIFRIEEARDTLKEALSSHDDWFELTGISSRRETIAPRGSVVASTFTAALEAARDGNAAIRQDKTFDPILVRAAHG
ncbi:segregation/condensation protein A [Parvularcula sp. ZS-1/3]|uniref:Segregation and condensation protein A n=1 Tax=Parvularcula mediterranea TaxID=2732508 RepID=A0A7Y3RMH1_9PROT|nr:segregation/condensation protein A [Parvularcula mediterranea]